jgi:hypothetical protein
MAWQGAALFSFRGSGSLSGAGAAFRLPGV